MHQSLYVLNEAAPSAIEVERELKSMCRTCGKSLASTGERFCSGACHDEYHFGPRAISTRDESIDNRLRKSRWL